MQDFRFGKQRQTIAERNDVAVVDVYKCNDDVTTNTTTTDLSTAVYKITTNVMKIYSIKCNAKPKSKIKHSQRSFKLNTRTKKLMTFRLTQRFSTVFTF